MTEESTTIVDKRVCYSCGSNMTYREKNGRHHWYGNPPIGWLCEKCNNKYVKNPKWHPITQTQTVRFGNKQHYVGKNVKIGVCNWCRAVKGEVNAQTGQLCKKTDIHHLQYHIENILKDTIEVCFSCHRKYHCQITP